MPAPVLVGFRAAHRDRAAAVDLALLGVRGGGGVALMLGVCYRTADETLATNRRGGAGLRHHAGLPSRRYYATATEKCPYQFAFAPTDVATTILVSPPPLDQGQPYGDYRDTYTSAQRPERP